MSAPYSYEFINLYNSAYDPSTVHCNNTSLTWFFKRYLLQKVFGVFKWKLPEWWNLDYFRYVLYNMGYIAVVNTDKFGIIPQLAGLKGYNVFYAPTRAIITSPLITGILEPIIDETCTIIKLTPDYCGLDDLIRYYANKMALAGEAADMNLINSKLAYLVAAKSKTMAEATKKIFDKVQAGNPFVVYDEKYKESETDRNISLFDTFTQNLNENFIAPEIMEVIRDLDNEFCNKIGLYTINADKRERLITDETRQDSNYATAEIWLENLKDGCKKTRDMFGIEIDVDWRFPHDSNNVNPGIVSV